MIRCAPTCDAGGPCCVTRHTLVGPPLSQRRRLGKHGRPHGGAQRRDAGRPRPRPGTTVTFEAKSSSGTKGVSIAWRAVSRATPTRSTCCRRPFCRCTVTCPHFELESQFGTWLYRIATNAALMLRRARTRRPTESLEALRTRFDAQGVHLATPAELQVASRADELLDENSRPEKAQGGRGCCRRTCARPSTHTWPAVRGASHSSHSATVTPRASCAEATATAPPADVQASLQAFLRAHRRVPPAEG